MKENEWIDVNFKMPETHKPVLCDGTLDGKRHVFAGCWESVRDHQDWYCFPETWCSCCRQPETVVNYWMPYPEKKSND